MCNIANPAKISTKSNAAIYSGCSKRHGIITTEKKAFQTLTIALFNRSLLATDQNTKQRLLAYNLLLELGKGTIGIGTVVAGAPQVWDLVFQTELRHGLAKIRACHCIPYNSIGVFHSVNCAGTLWIIKIGGRVSCACLRKETAQKDKPRYLLAAGDAARKHNLAVRGRSL